MGLREDIETLWADLHLLHAPSYEAGERIIALLIAHDDIDTVLTEKDTLATELTEARKELGERAATIARLQERLESWNKAYESNPDVELASLRAANASLKAERDTLASRISAHELEVIGLVSEANLKWSKCLFEAVARAEKAEAALGRLRDREARVRAIVSYAVDKDAYDAPRLELPYDVLAILDEQEEPT